MQYLGAVMHGRVDFFDQYFVNVLLYSLVCKYISIGTRLVRRVPVKYLLGIP